MANPMWPNVDRSQYLRERFVAERHRADAVIKFTGRGDRLAALMVSSQIYAVTDPSVTDLIAAVCQGSALH